MNDSFGVTLVQKDKFSNTSTDCYHPDPKKYFCWLTSECSWEEISGFMGGNRRGQIISRRLRLFLVVSWQQIFGYLFLKTCPEHCLFFPPTNLIKFSLNDPTTLSGKITESGNTDITPRRLPYPGSCPEGHQPVHQRSCPCSTLQSCWLMAHNDRWPTALPEAYSLPRIKAHQAWLI